MNTVLVLKTIIRTATMKNNNKTNKYDNNNINKNKQQQNDLVVTSW